MFVGLGRRKRLPSGLGIELVLSLISPKSLFIRMIASNSRRWKLLCKRSTNQCQHKTARKFHPREDETYTHYTLQVSINLDGYALFTD
jgi:hypothetical protein